VEPSLSYASATYPPTRAVQDRLHSAHARLLRRCLGAAFALDFDTWIHPTTEQLYATYTHQLTLPAIATRQRLQAWGHWARDHVGKDRDYIIRHPVIEVLEWAVDPPFLRKRGGQIKTTVDAFVESVQEPASDRITLELVHDKDWGLAMDKKHWYLSMRQKTKEMDQRVLRQRIDARKSASDRALSRGLCPRRLVTEKEYGKALSLIYNEASFATRFLTRKLKEDAQIMRWEQVGL
jgi:hypothetical protein